MLASLILLIDSPEERSRFEQLYHEYERLMFFVANQRLGDRHLAEDAVNEAFIRIIRHFDEIEEISCPRTRRYVVVIVKNVCADIYHKRNCRSEFAAGDSIEHLADYEDIHTISSQDAFFQKYDLELVRDALRDLPELYQSALYLSVVEEKSLEEMADLLDCKVETVKKRLYRARKELRNSLEIRDDQ